jgi:5-methylcytosine-specific restriction endonuclease McrBC regulatory subunit McrC
MVSGFGLILGMERLFEEFVEKSLLKAVRFIALEDVEIRAQDTRAYAFPTESDLRCYFTRPDDVLYLRNKPVLVIDAKYKKLADADEINLKKPANSDVYQLVASMTAHDCSDGLLIYPKMFGDADLGDGQVRSWKVDAFGKQLRVNAVALDLASLQTSEDLLLLDQHLADVVTSVLPAEVGALV